MKKISKAITIFLLFCISVMCLSGCESNSKIETAIKEKCEEISTNSLKQVESSFRSGGFIYTWSKPNTVVSYDEKLNKFTCTIKYDESYTSIYDSSNVMRSSFSTTFYGHMNGDSVVIDDFRNSK